MDEYDIYADPLFVLYAYIKQDGILNEIYFSIIPPLIFLPQIWEECD